MIRICASLLILLVIGCAEQQVDVVPNPRLHTFYYNWCGNPEVDGKYHHWEHDILPHWSDTSWDNVGRFSGGNDIGANFYPGLGCYSSNDSTLIGIHMEMIRDTEIGVEAITWWEKGFIWKPVDKEILKSSRKLGNQSRYSL